MKAVWTTVAIIAVVGASIWAFKYYNPGVYAPKKCNQGGDDTRKFYDPNWQARGAVCDGLYIPFGVKKGGYSNQDILATMGQLYGANNALKSDMKNLANLAIASLTASGRG